MQRRVIRSYRLMLRFYGLELANEVTGRVERDPEGEVGLANLNTSAHNWLRVSRIIDLSGGPDYELSAGTTRLVVPIDDQVGADILGVLDETHAAIDAAVEALFDQGDTVVEVASALELGTISVELPE